MSARERDARVARALGWVGKEEETYSPCTEWVWRDRKGYKLRYDTPLSSNPLVARVIEDEIERRGLGAEYIKALAGILELSVWDTGRHHVIEAIETDDAFKCLRASPDSRYQAAVKVLEERWTR
jgi:hypothetical protein